MVLETDTGFVATLTALATRYATPINISIAVVVLVLGYIVKCRFLGPLRHIPGPWWSYYTQIPDYYHLVAGDRALYIHSLHQKYGNTIRVGPRCIGVSGTEGVKAVYGTGLQKAFPRDPAVTSMFNLLRTPGADNIASFHLPSDAIRRRRQYGNVYSKGSILGMQDTFQKSFQGYKDKLEALRRESPEGVVPMVRCFRALAFDIITKVAFGGFYKCSEDLDHQLKLLDTLMLANHFQLYFGDFIYNMAKKIPWKRLDWIRSLDEFCMPTINSTTFYIANSKASSGIVRKDLLGQLLSHNLPKPTVESEALGNMFAGTDTTGNSTAFIACDILKHPKAHKKLVDELDRVFPDEEYTMFDLMDYRKLESECKYLTWCIKEGMRRNSLQPGPALRVVPEGGATINGFYIPEKLDIFAQTHTATHNPEVFPEPLEFRPERWEEETGVMRGQWTVFGSGPRICPGENLAMMEMQMMLALLFRNYRVSAAPETNMETTEFWLRAMKAGELYLKLEPRSSPSYPVRREGS